MGKGDKKSRRGKITMGSHGVLRPSKKNKAKAAAASKVAAPKKAAAPKKVAEPKKAAAPKKVAAPKKAAKKAE